MQKLTFTNNKNLFFRSLKSNVDTYFSENKIHTSGNTPLYIKAALLILSAVSIYIILVFFTPNIFISIFLCALFGINLAAIGFNIMHEGGHHTFSKYKWLNITSAYFLNVLGGNANFWRVKHNHNHHTFTNIADEDDDIDIKPLMRMSESQPKYWFHKFQYIYWVVLYGLSYFAWVYFLDFKRYFRGRVVGEQKLNFDFKEHLIFWGTKVGYTLVFLVIPLLVLGWKPFLIGFLVMGVTCGLFLSIVFQLAHVTESTVFPTVNKESNKIESEWAVHQLATTANFATKNRILFTLLGGLNFQVEHHLFPRISHVHYRKVNEIVMETCKTFNVHYIEHRSMFSALCSHVRHLKKMGVSPVINN